MEYVGIILFISSFILTLLLTPVVRKIAKKRKFLDKPGERKVHRVATPLGGGVALFIGIFLPIFTGLLIAYIINESGAPEWIPYEVTKHIPGVLDKVSTLFIIFCGGVVIVFTGFIDDLKGLFPSIKLAVQICIALILVINGISASLFIESKIIGAIISVFWIVGITNALNFMDNMDGLSCGVSFILSVVFLIIAIQTQQLFISSMLFVFLGAIAGFLIYNFHPASIFLGDSGSLLLGYLLSVLTIVFTFYEEGTPLSVITLPVLILAVPIFDMVAVIIIRLKMKKSIFVGDKNHLSHRLVKLGMTERESVLMIYLITFCVGLAAILLYRADIVGTVIIGVETLCIFFIILLLERAGRRGEGDQ